MQDAEVRIVSGFGKGIPKCVIGTIMPKSNMPSAWAFSPDVEVYRWIVLSKMFSPKTH